MAKGSVRKKGKKWYFRFYLDDENGNRVQKELPGTESKSETESLLRKAMEEYENQRFVAKTINLSLGDMLDMWIREGLNPSSRSNGTVRSYMNVVNCVKRHPIGKRKLKVVTAEHLQAYFDSLVIDKVDSDGKLVKALSSGTLHVYAAVLRGAFRFAVFPKQLITFNPMQYVVLRESNDDFELFSDETNSSVPTVSDKQYAELTGYLKEKNNPALLPIQIAYYTGLRIGEVCALTWQDIDLDEQYLTVRRSICYDNIVKKLIIGPTKRKRIRTVDFCDTLAKILKNAKQQQIQRKQQYGEFYHHNYYVSVKEKSRTYHEVHTMPISASVPETYNKVSFVCLRQDGTREAPHTVSDICKSIRKRVAGLENFHFHMLRHTYTSKLLAHGAAPKDVQELLGHLDINTTLNVYAHATRESKRSSAMLLDGQGCTVEK